MTTYQDLGPTLLLTAAPDPSNKYGAGNYTITADEAALNAKVALAEVYQITIDGPVGSSMQLWRNQRWWNTVQQGWQNNYDPSNPLYVRPGDTLFFYWNVSSGTPVPVATIWLRFDMDYPANKPKK